jgi:hypothetical protein
VREEPRTSVGVERAPRQHDEPGLVFPRSLWCLQQPDPPHSGAAGWIVRSHCATRDLAGRAPSRLGRSSWAATATCPWQGDGEMMATRRPAGPMVRASFHAILSAFACHDTPASSSTVPPRWLGSTSTWDPSFLCCLPSFFFFFFFLRCLCLPP